MPKIEHSCETPFIRERKEFGNLLKSFGNQVLHALRFWQPSMNRTQIFVTRINAFLSLQKYSMPFLFNIEIIHPRKYNIQIRFAALKLITPGE